MWLDSPSGSFTPPKESQAMIGQVDEHAAGPVNSGGEEKNI
jgi:hypothetical protein